MTRLRARADEQFRSPPYYAGLLAELKRCNETPPSKRRLAVLKARRIEWHHRPGSSQVSALRMGTSQSLGSVMSRHFERRAYPRSRSTAYVGRLARCPSGAKYRLAWSPRSRGTNPPRSLRSTIAEDLWTYCASGMTRSKAGRLSKQASPKNQRRRPDKQMANTAGSAPIDAAQHPQGRIAVIGNGHADPSVTLGCLLRFRFNAETVDLDPDLDINVRMLKGAEGRARLKIELANGTSVLNALEESINLGLPLQASDLGCLPSTGYALIHALWATGAQLQITGVGFDPSLTRPLDLGRKRPLPQAFHNWLGERRTTFHRWLDCPQHDWTWELVSTVRQAQVQLRDERAVHGYVHYLEVLDCMRNTARSCRLADFARLGGQSILPTLDLLHPHPLIKELEGGFFLDRHQKSTPNWWLFDAEASALAETIASNIRQAQHQAFLHEIEHSPANCRR